ncbi:MAG: hypothetical protein ABI338_08880, partial [Gemmatimonadaceae bacterium]
MEPPERSLASMQLYVKWLRRAAIIRALWLPPLLALALAQSSMAQAARSNVSATVARTMTAVRTTGPIRIDGKLDEPDWQRA